MPHDTITTERRRLGLSALLLAAVLALLPRSLRTGTRSGRDRCAGPYRGAARWLMLALLAFALTVLVSALAHRSVVSTSVLFLNSGFAFGSVFFAMLILGSSVPQAGRIFNLMAVVFAASIILHSSTDVLVAHWVEREKS